MVYYQILKQRRKDLNLSIHDVSSQTRLAPQYIAAIEENDLDVFLGDFDFVRRFVKAYSELIGVNWEFIKDDVDLNISRYIEIKSQAPSQQVILRPTPEMYDVEEAPSFNESPAKKAAKKGKKAPASAKKNASGKKKAKTTKKKVRSKVNVDIQGSAKKAVKWTKASRNRFIAAVVVGILAVLFGFNMILNKISSEQDAAEDLAKQAELKAKEEETAKLANQKKETSKKTAEEEREKNKLETEVESDALITCTDKENNIFTITNLIETDQRLTFEVSLPSSSTIAIYQDDTPINDNEQEYSKLYTETFTIDHTCLIQLEITNFQDNTIIVNGKEIKFDTTLWYEGEPAILYFEVKTNEGAGGIVQQNADIEEIEEEEQ